MCDKNCSCILCLELRGCEKQVIMSAMDCSTNFILRSNNENNKVKSGQINYTFFGMEDVKSLQKVIKEETDENNNNNDGLIVENKHKSIIYVNDNNSTISNDTDAQIIKSEIIDEFMSLTAVENSRVITVVFKETFSYANQLVNEVMLSCQVYYDSADEDDFPLGMEAEYLNRTSGYYLKKKW